ncbi:unnamed protein product [Diabrotica balteata]|uniref:Uncharacterized protein n=1 Tax=Diabrotica balteata TaxID=107213 RepID=A0A9N9X6V6_DIABA|nr:unnamed protein product [Diabrotica balteata]
MKLLFFLAVLTIVHSEQITKVRKLIQSFNYEDDETEKLISETRTLIATTKAEMVSLQNTAGILMENNIQILERNIQNLSDYSNNRTSDLIVFLKNEIDLAVSNKRATDPVKEECLLVYDYLSTLQTSFEKRLEVSLTTAIRNANLTVRKDFESMDIRLLELVTLNRTLDICEEVSACVLEVSQKVVDYNTEFIAEFTDINTRMSSVPQDALNAAILNANSSVNEDENYACNSAIIMMSCVESFDNNTTDTTTTWLPSNLPSTTSPISTITSTYGPSTDTTMSTSSEISPSYESTTIDVTTVGPNPIYTKCRLNNYTF